MGRRAQAIDIVEETTAVVLHLLERLASRLAHERPYEGQGDQGGQGVEPVRAAETDGACNGRKVTVTAKFATQLVAPETASAAPRIRLGNISPSSTHITGPQEIAKATTYRLAATRPVTAAAWPRIGCPLGPTPAVAKTTPTTARVTAMPAEPASSSGLRPARSMSAIAGIVARMLTRPVRRLIRRAHCSVAPADFHRTSP